MPAATSAARSVVNPGAGRRKNVRNVKLVNGMLWVLNTLLGGGIVFFAWAYLLFPAEASHIPSDVPALNIDKTP